ncbi:MAG: chitinase [Phycisphaerales bacterium]|jgi:chitinase|nr:chitinase [Phycisphaerales bacterium]
MYRTLACLFALLIVSHTTLAAPPAHGKRVIGYYAGWSVDRFPATKIRGDLLTHVNYAFAIIDKDHECVARDPKHAEKGFAQLRELKAKYPHLKTLISVGGWTDSTGFYDTAKTAESREKFAKSAAAFAKMNGFDGVDIDWEYPGGGGNDKGMGGPEDTKNFTALLTELRKQLDAQGIADHKKYLLTIAAPAGGALKRIELDRIHPLLDFINLMTYDFAGSWSGRTAFNAPLYPWGDHEQGKFAGDVSVQAYQKAGVPTDKIVLGVPFYGRAFGGVKSGDTDGLYQPFDPRAKTTSPDGWGWRSISANYIDKKAKRFWSEPAKVPWLFDEKTGLFVSYDDPQSLRDKAEYARNKHLGGVMIWELSDDDEQASLLKALNAGLAK